MKTYTINGTEVVKALNRGGATSYAEAKHGNTPYTVEHGGKVIYTRTVNEPDHSKKKFLYKGSGVNEAKRFKALSKRNGAK